MPRIIDELTPEEVEAIKKLDADYKPRLDAAHERMNNALKAWSKEHSQANADELEAASDEEHTLSNEWLSARARLQEPAQDRIYKSFEGDAPKILDLIKREVPRHIALLAVFAGDKPTEKERKEQAKRAEKGKKEIEAGIAYDRAELEKRPDDEELKKALSDLEELLESGDYDIKPHYDVIFSDEAIRAGVHESMSKYLGFLEKVAPDMHKEALEYIESCIARKDEMYITMLDAAEEEKPNYPAIKTTVPGNFITTTDKPSNTLFSVDNEALYTHKLIAIGVSRKSSKKEINTLLSVNIDELEREGVQISARQLTPFDREVHDAIATLFVEGGNDIMSLQMIYRTMTGDRGAKLTKKQSDAISAAITKMMYTVITIDATEEAKAFGFDDFKYKGNLLYAEMAIASINNNTVEALHIVKEPVLYTYANRSNKIGRLDLNLLNSPVSKNEETIVLQGYLYRRILTMKNNAKMHKSIVYDTVYKQIGVDAATDGALRKKKAKVREKVRAILDYWKKKNFISDYAETDKGQEKYSVTIKL